jgi:hypothetical protein
MILTYKTIISIIIFPQKMWITLVFNITKSVKMWKTLRKKGLNGAFIPIFTHFPQLLK